jgi:hypothetical protein
MVKVEGLSLAKLWNTMYSLCIIMLKVEDELSAHSQNGMYSMKKAIKRWSSVPAEPTLGDPAPVESPVKKR